MMEFFGVLDAEKNWTKQLHLGALRDPNSRIAAKLGADTGCDTIGDFKQGTIARALSGPADRIGKLPKTILYNVNPADNYLFAGNAGKFSGWLDCRAKSNTARRGGFWIRKTASAPNSTRFRI